jgi:hypothetical protein
MGEYVYNRRNERFASSSVQEVDSFGGDNVMMWAAISNDHKTAIQVFRLQWLMRQRFDSVDERPGCTDLAQE